MKKRPIPAGDQKFKGLRVHKMKIIETEHPNAAAQRERRIRMRFTTAALMMPDSWEIE